MFQSTTIQRIKIQKHQLMNKSLTSLSDTSNSLYQNLITTSKLQTTLHAKKRVKTKMVAKNDEVNSRNKTLNPQNKKVTVEHRTPAEKEDTG